MVEILNRGNNPGDRTYTVTCRSCESLLRFTASEAERVHDHRDGDYMQIACPICNHTITKNANHYDKPAARLLFNDGALGFY
jgi:uncharacterized protein YfaT (DUF1175 family)